MGLSLVDLKLLRYIQEKQTISLKQVAKYFAKNESSIRKEIELINLYLDDNQCLKIKNGIIYTEMSYYFFSNFIGNLKYRDYSSEVNERLNVIITKVFFNGYINLSKQYSSWSLSLTTKKNDTKILKPVLNKNNLDLVILRKKGITIEGDEIKFRLLLIQIILPLIDLEKDFTIVKRVANNPLEREIVEEYFKHTEKYFVDAKKLCIDFLSEYKYNLNYLSKKFLILYNTFIYLRQKALIINEHQLPVKILNLYYVNHKKENKAFNQTVGMLDFYPPLSFPFDEKLYQATTEFVKLLKKDFINYDLLIQELYNYFYKQLFILYYQFIFTDKIVRNTKQELQSLYAKIQNAILVLNNMYNVEFNEEQLSTITLITKKWINISKVIGMNEKRIIIVTNTYFERIDYFVEMLKDKIAFKLVASYDINEIYNIEKNTYDEIIVFSDRIKGILNQQGYNSIKINFYFTNEDIQRLIENGFSVNNRRFKVNDLAKKLVNKNEQEIKEYLIDEYSDYFV